MGGGGCRDYVDNWLRGVDLIGNRFNTVIGAIFLAIVLILPVG